MFSRENAFILMAVEVTEPKGKARGGFLGPGWVVF